MRGLSLVVVSGGPLFIGVRGPLTVAASLVAEHRLQTRRLSSCGSRAQLLRGMWDLPRPGLELMSPCIGRQILNHCATREAQKERSLVSGLRVGGVCVCLSVYIYHRSCISCYYLFFAHLLYRGLRGKIILHYWCP